MERCYIQLINIAENITLVSGSQDQTLKVWQVSVGDATASLVATLTGHEAGVEAAEISPDGNMVRYSSSKCNISLLTSIPAM